MKGESHEKKNTVHLKEFQKVRQNFIARVGANGKNSGCTQYTRFLYHVQFEEDSWIPKKKELNILLEIYMEMNPKALWSRKECAQTKY